MLCHRNEIFKKAKSFLIYMNSSRVIRSRSVVQVKNTDLEPFNNLRVYEIWFLALKEIKHQIQIIIPSFVIILYKLCTFVEARPS